MPDIAYDRYPTFTELTAWLVAFAEEFHDLVERTSIGTSYEGRDLWLTTVTNHSVGTASEKPAIWIDGKIHASEVTATVVIVHLIDQLTGGFGSDPDITQALDTRTFYLVPRVNPNGAELALAELPSFVRGSVHAWPFTEQRPGLVSEDVDHDGRILQMRVEDPNGTWKPYANDARLMVAREPDEDGARPYYRLLGEGTLHDYDGIRVPSAPFKAGIDPNRQFPYRWERKVEGPWDAGDYPGSEPEIAALLRAITEWKNICTYFAHHTFSGVHIRAYSNQADEALAADDLWTYEVLGEMATELTGYESIFGFHDFRYHPKSIIRGVGTDWAFDHLGVYAWTTEFWSALQAAGLDEADPLEWYRTHPWTRSGSCSHGSTRTYRWLRRRVRVRPPPTRPSRVGRVALRARVPQSAGASARSGGGAALSPRDSRRVDVSAAAAPGDDRRTARRRNVESSRGRGEPRMDEDGRHRSRHCVGLGAADGRAHRSARWGIAGDRHRTTRARPARWPSFEAERGALVRRRLRRHRRPDGCRVGHPGARGQVVRRRGYPRPSRRGPNHGHARLTRTRCGNPLPDRTSSHGRLGPESHHCREFGHVPRNTPDARWPDPRTRVGPPGGGNSGLGRLTGVVRSRRRLRLDITGLDVAVFAGLGQRNGEHQQPEQRLR